jgi:hypothetical protein
MVVQDTFGKIFNEGTEFQRDGSSSTACSRTATLTDRFHDGLCHVHAGTHTPLAWCMLWATRPLLATRFSCPMADRRAPISPAAMPERLYDSIQKVLALPDEMRLFMCHDYGPNGRDIQWETTVAEEKAHNIHVGGGKTREDFIKFRTERDAQLGMPR